MTKPANIYKEIDHGNGIVEIIVMSKPRSGRMHSASYPTTWGYWFNGEKYTSYKAAKAAAKVTEVNPL